VVLDRHLLANSRRCRRVDAAAIAVNVGYNCGVGDVTAPATDGPASGAVSTHAVCVARRALVVAEPLRLVLRERKKRPLLLLLSFMREKIICQDRPRTKHKAKLNRRRRKAPHFFSHSDRSEGDNSCLEQAGDLRSIVMLQRFHEFERDQHLPPRTHARTQHSTDKNRSLHSVLSLS
jgi:hypothetical protein